MKKIITYILSALLLGLLNACKSDNLAIDVSHESGDDITLNFAIVIPETQSVQTRVLLGEAAGENTQGYLGGLVPYLFIFEDTGSPESNYLRTLVHGSLITLGEETMHVDGNVRCQSFSATVDGTAENAIVHLVLIQKSEQETFEEQLAQMTDRSELGMFSGATGLYTREAAYWKRICLNMPINSTHKDEINTLLSHIKMVRNFAQVTINKDASVTNFQIDGFVIVNAMDCGYVAAYNEKTGTDYDNFVDFADASGNLATYEYLTQAVNYIPNRHPEANRVNKDNEQDWVNTLTLEDWNPDQPKYMFERPYQDTHRTFVLLKGYYNGSTQLSYYKLDIGAYDNTHYDPDDHPYGVFEPYSLIRSMSYDFKITSVASDGDKTPEEALAAIPANNISASMETRNVLSITDGVDEISIEAYNGDNNKLIDGTTVVIINDDSGKPVPSRINLRWQYWDDETNGYNNAVVKHSFPGYELKTGDDVIIKSKSDWAGAGMDWNGYTLAFNEPTDIPQQETIKFYKPFGLSRDITFILRRRWEFVNRSPESYVSNIEVYPGLYSFEDNTMPAETLDEMRDLITPGKVGSQRGAQLTVMFELPSDIPQQLFPLEFKIGFDRQNAENAYAGNATVVYGESMFEDDNGGVGVPRMQFVKTVTWDYYNGSGDPGDHGHKIVTARFLTTTDVLASNETDDATGETSTTRVRVTNPYFLLGQDDFQRNVQVSDPDANRNTWVWYFGDAGWDTYFSTVGHEAGTYNGLNFDTHTWGTQYGKYMGMAPGHTEGNPEIWFEVNNTPSETNQTATLTVTAASLWYRKNDYYRRKGLGIAQIKTADGTTRTVQLLLGDYDKRNTSSGNSQQGMPLERSVSFTVNSDETVEWVKLWSEKLNNTDKEDTDNAKTLYYGIRLTLTPN